jgi:hypothetical protein
MKLSKNIFSNNIFIINIIIFFIVFLLIILYYKTYYNKEHYSNGILDLLQYNGEPIKYNIDENTDENNKDNIKKNNEISKIYKHIFLKNNSKNNNISFKFYNKKMQNYLIIKGHNKNNMKIEDIDNNNFGNINHYKYNTFTTQYNDYNVDYTLLYNDKRLIKITLENDIYYIIEDVKNKKYKIYLFELDIGSINKINNNTYKLVIEEKYKTVLNIIGFGLIIEILRNKL